MVPGEWCFTGRESEPIARDGVQWGLSAPPRDRGCPQGLSVPVMPLGEGPVGHQGCSKAFLHVLSNFIAGNSGNRTLSFKFL